MTEEDLNELIKNHESDRIEFTTGTTDTDKFSEAVCAFSNDLPNHRKEGYLIIGVDNKGHFSALNVTDQLLQTLGGLRDNGNIQPLPTISIEKVVSQLGEVAVVKVSPSFLPPVRYKGRVCIRIGPRRGYATEAEERILIERRVAHARTFDAMPCLGSSLSDLSQSMFLLDYRPHVIAAEIIEENHRPIAEQLASLRFFDLPNNCPTHAGILLFAMDVRRFLSGAYVQFLKVSGETLADDITNERELSGDMLTNLRDLDALVDSHIQQYPVAQTNLTEKTAESFPHVAVRELLMNAVMHRDYASTAPLRVTWLSDRLEIQSPGGLYGEASPENFPKQTSYRNPVLAESLKAFGYVNRYGRGIERAQAALKKNGSKPAEFKFDSGYVLATIWNRK